MATRPAKRPAPTNTPLSIPGLHALLWQWRLGDDTVIVTQVELARQLGVSGPQMNRYLRRMVELGRLADVDGNTRHGQRCFAVADPADFPLEKP